MAFKKILGILVCLTSSLYGQDTKDAFWNLEIGATNHSIQSSVGSSLLGTSASIHIGTGTFFPLGFYEFGMEVISGPYQSSRSTERNLDYYGTGISGKVGLHLFPKQFRKNSWSSGILLGAEYSDITGNSFDDVNSNPTAGNNIRVISYLISPGIFFGYIQKPRLDGNDAELLSTRIEAILFTLNISFPISNKFKGNFESSSQTLKMEDNVKKYSIGNHSIKLGVNFLLGV